jgi:hypothetical protein
VTSSSSCVAGAQDNEYANVSTPEFIALSERVSGQDLDAFFKAWLFTKGNLRLANPQAAR